MTVNLENGMAFKAVLKKDGDGNPSIDIKLAGQNCQGVELVQVSRTIVAPSGELPKTLYGKDWTDLGPNQTYLQGIADHQDAEGWFVDIDYASEAFTSGPGRYHPPFYNTYHGGHSQGPGTLSDHPTILQAFDAQVTEFIVGAYCKSTKKWLGFMSWAFVSENGETFMLHNPKGASDMPTFFRSALDQFAKVVDKSGNGSGF